jgi:hypothetical protein
MVHNKTVNILDVVFFLSYDLYNFAPDSACIGHHKTVAYILWII